MTRGFNISEIIQNQIPDADGSVIPATVHEGKAEIAGPQGMIQHILVVMEASTYNVRKATCNWICVSCGDQIVDGVVYADPWTAGVKGQTQLTGTAQDSEGKKYSPLSWSSSSTAIATISSGGLVTGVSVGSATTSAYFGTNATISQDCGDPPEEGCGEFVPVYADAPGTVFDVGVKAENGYYILVGSDPTVTAPNLFQFTNQAQLGAPQPPGGTCCAASSDPSDTVTQTDGPPNQLYEFRFGTLDQSTTVGDRILTFEYTLSDGEATSVQINVTAREFAYVTSPNPPNMCQASGGKYGYLYTYVYTPYTEPDKQPISAGIAEGAPVTETVTPQSGGTACTNAVIPGNGSLNGSGEFQDQIQLCSNSPIPACDKKYTQVIQIAGYPKTTLGARTNTLEYTNTQLIYTSQGPTQ